MIIHSCVVRVVALVLVGILGVVMALGLLHLSSGHTLAGSPPPCGHDIEMSAWCPVMVASALDSWEGVFLGVVTLLWITGLTSISATIVFRWPHHTARLVPLVVAHCCTEKQTQLPNLFQELFARGILHPKLYRQ